MITECTYLGEHIEPCGGAVVPGRSYCEAHLWTVYKQGSAVTRRKDTRTADAVWDLQSELNSIVEELIEEGMDL
jgi:hypothetical protein